MDRPVGHVVRGGVVTVPELRVCLFCRFGVRRGEAAVPGLEAAKAQELFAYLLIHRSRPHFREVLAALLWADHPTAQAKKYLRQALWELQSALDPAAPGVPSGSGYPPGRPRLLHVEADWVQLNPDAALWLDVAEFERAFAGVEGVPGETLDAPTADRVQAAIQLYQGDLLEGCYQDWCLYERERLHTLYLALLDKLMAYCEANGLVEQGLLLGRRSLQEDRALERTHRRMMALHLLAGDRAAALRQFGRCVAALNEEFGVLPTEETLDLYERIKAGLPSPAATAPPAGSSPTASPAPAAIASPSTVPSTVSPSASPAPPPVPGSVPASRVPRAPETAARLPEAAPLAGTLDSLHHLRATLALIQQQVQREIHSVERAVHALGSPASADRRK